MRKAIFFALTLLLSGCELAQICTTEARPGIGIIVVDSISNARPQVSVTATVSDGSFEETAILGPEAPGNAFSFAHERAGRYRVTVQASGYHPWARDNVLVVDGECHVRTTELRALLQPL